MSRVQLSLSWLFIAVAALGIVGAFYHAWTEEAFTTTWAIVSFAPYASFLGIPYWVFGIVWFPMMLVAGLYFTKLGRGPLPKELLILVTVGNVFTGYLWYLDLVVVDAFTVVYVALYAANYALTALVVASNWTSDVMRGYLYGTITGALVGLLFGPYGVAACGIGGGIFGALRNYVMPVQVAVEAAARNPR